MSALRLRPLVLSLALLVPWAANALAADGMTKAERDAEAQELAEEDRTTTAKNVNFSGTFMQYTDAQIKSSGDATVIGRFDSSSDEPMLVRATNDKVKAELKKLSGKQVVVSGRARLNGKYLYVARMVVVAPANAYVPPGGGL